jgi:tRNA U38,U39,U40 pseudouridine synthase TruA
MVGVII